jgi:exonuclease III
MRIVSWNAEVNRTDDEFGDALANLIRDLNPGVICLQEAGAYVNVCRNRFADDWWTYAHNDWNEANNDPVLVSRRYAEKQRGDAHGWNTLRNKTGWEGPHGHAHPGRTWTWVYVDGRFVMSLHRVTGGKKKNKAAFKEERANLVAWIEARPDDPIIVIGDHNIGPYDKATAGSWEVAYDVSGSCRHDDDDAGIDYAVCKRQKASEVKRVGSYGSDHKALLFVTAD